MFGHLADQLGNLIPLVLAARIVKGRNIAMPLIRVSTLRFGTSVSGGSCWQSEGNICSYGKFPRGARQGRGMAQRTVMIEEGQTDTGVKQHNRGEAKEAASITGTDAHPRQQRRIEILRPEAVTTAMIRLGCLGESRTRPVSILAYRTVSPRGFMWPERFRSQKISRNLKHQPKLAPDPSTTSPWSLSPV